MQNQEVTAKLVTLPSYSWVRNQTPSHGQMQVFFIQTRLTLSPGMNKGEINKCLTQLWDVWKLTLWKTISGTGFEKKYSTWDLLQNWSSWTDLSAYQHTVIKPTFSFPSITQKYSKPINLKAYLLQWQTVVKHIWVPRTEMDWGE